MEEVLAFGKFAKAKVEDAGAMSVQKNNGEQRRRSKQVRQRLQMKMAVDKKLRAAKRRGQLVFPPDILRRTGKNRFRMRAVAAQFPGEPDDTVNIDSCAVFSTFALERTHRLAPQILDEDRVFFVCFIARCGWLKIKTDSARILVLKFSQFTDLFASHAHGISPQIDNLH
jgi:hypothetical protein